MDSGCIIMNAGARIYVLAENQPAKYAPKKVSRYCRYMGGTRIKRLEHARKRPNMHSKVVVHVLPIYA